MGGGEQVSAVAALFRNGSALSVCREICWRLSASAGGEQGGGARARARPSVSLLLVLDGMLVESRRLLTQAVLGERHVPLGSCKLLLALGAAAVSRFGHRAAGQQLGQQGGPHLLQLSVCCRRKTPGVEAKGPRGKIFFFLLLFSKLTSLFLHLSGFGDVGVRVERLGGEALALLVLQWRHIWQLQRTERTVKRFL